MIQWFKDGKKLPKRYVWEIVLGAHDQFVKEQSLVDVPIAEGVTVDVIGDVHGSCSSKAYWMVLRLIVCIAGQYYDVLHLFSLTGKPSEKHYLLMNGDLVDRGSWSMEVILTAFAYKCGSIPCTIASAISDDLERALPEVHVHQPRESRSERDEPSVRV